MAQLVRSENYIRFMFEVDTDVNFRALAMIGNDSPKTEGSSELSVMTTSRT